MKSFLKTGTCLAAALMVSQWGFAADPADSNGPETVGQQENKSPQANTVQRDAAAQDKSSGGKDHAMKMDEHFVRHAAWAGMGEIAMSKVAVERAESNDIKQFAQHMIDDHTKANDQLAQIAQSKGLDVPKSLDPVDQAKLDMLQKVPSGREFDRAYIYGQVAMHIEVVLKFRDATQDLKDPQLRQFAVDTYPTLTMHLQEAEKLAGMNGDAVQAGARISHDVGTQNHATNGTNGTSGINGGRETSEHPDPNSSK